MKFNTEYYIPTSASSGVGKQKYDKNSAICEICKISNSWKVSFVNFREFFSQHHLWFYVQVYAAVMKWTCLVCWLHTGSSWFCQVMDYTQFHADNLFVCAGHYETARQKSCCTHCIQCLQAVSRFFSVQNHSLPKFMPTKNLYSIGNAVSRANFF